MRDDGYCQTGWHKDEYTLHGWAKETCPDPEQKEETKVAAKKPDDKACFWVDDAVVLRKNIEKKHYNPNTDPRGRELDLAKYITPYKKLERQRADNSLMGALMMRD